MNKLNNTTIENNEYKTFSEMTTEEFNNLSQAEINYRLDKLNLDVMRSMVESKIDFIHTQLLADKVLRTLESFNN